jgi:hypothetical protein
MKCKECGKVINKKREREHFLECPEIYVACMVNGEPYKVKRKDIPDDSIRLRQINLKGLEGYLITDDGQVWSTYSKRWIKPVQNNFGYIYYAFRVTEHELFSHHSPRFSVHRMVALTYIGEPPTPKHEIDHIDGNKGNNHYSNLRWCTHSENILRSYREQGRISYSKGKNRPSPGLETRMKMSDAKNKPIEVYKGGEYITEYPSITKACESKVFNREGIYRMLHGKIKEYRGYTFKFK